MTKTKTPAIDMEALERSAQQSIEQKRKMRRLARERYQRTMSAMKAEMDTWWKDI